MPRIASLVVKHEAEKRVSHDGRCANDTDGDGAGVLLRRHAADRRSGNLEADQDPGSLVSQGPRSGGPGQAQQTRTRAIPMAVPDPDPYAAAASIREDPRRDA